MTMTTWHNKKVQKSRKGSQTTGKSKGKTCVADSMQKYFAKHSRSYKTPGYSDWCRRMDALNGKR